jgi:hypothetical protein
MEETGILENPTSISLVLPDFEPGRKNRHFPPFSTTFSTIFTGFFCELAHQGANSRECGPGKRQFSNHAPIGYALRS